MWLCALKWSAIGVGVGVWSVFLACVSFSFGWNRATRRYWSMLSTVGSRMSGVK